MLSKNPKFQIFDHIKESAWISQTAKKNYETVIEGDISTNLVLAWATIENLAFPLHSLDYLTEMRKLQPELRNKNDHCDNPRKIFRAARIKS